MTDKMSALLKELECPVCCNYMRKPIHLCITGHSICGDCTAKIKMCPICRLKITGRNYTLEKLCGQIGYPCCYRNEGCKETVREINNDHEENCAFKPIPCKKPKCTWKGKQRFLWDHWIHNHLLRPQGVPYFSFMFNLIEDDIFLLQYKSSYYTCRIHHRPDAKFCIVFLVGGSPRSIQNVSYNLRFEYADTFPRNKRMTTYGSTPICEEDHLNIKSELPKLSMNELWQNTNGIIIHYSQLEIWKELGGSLNVKLWIFSQ